MLPFRCVWAFFCSHLTTTLSGYQTKSIQGPLQQPINFPCACTSLTFSATAIVPFFVNTGCSLYQCIDLTMMLDPITYLSIQKKTGDKKKSGQSSLQYRFLPAREKNKQLEWDIGHDKSNQNQDSSFQKCGWIQLWWNLLPFQRATAKLYVDLEIDNVDKNTSTETKLFTVDRVVKNSLSDLEALVSIPGSPPSPGVEGWVY